MTEWWGNARPSVGKLIFMARKEEVTRFYIRTDSSEKLKRLVNIVVIQNESGQVIELKVTFEGVKNYQQWTLLRNAVGDSRIGIRRIQGQSSHQGELSVGYHADGNVMIKIQENFKPRRYPPIRKLHKPKLFLRISGFSIDDLHAVKRRGKTNEEIIMLANISKRSPITCDFYISGPTFGVSNGDPSIFESGKTYSYHDVVSKTRIHLHFYKTEMSGLLVVVPKTGVYAQIEKRILYFWYQYIYKIMGWKPKTVYPKT